MSENPTPNTEEFLERVVKSAIEKAKLELLLNEQGIEADEARILTAGILLGATEAMLVLNQMFENNDLFKDGET